MSEAISPEMQAFREQVARSEKVAIDDVLPAPPDFFCGLLGHRIGLVVTFPCPKHDVELDTLRGLCAWCGGTGRRKASTIIGPDGRRV